MALLAAQAWAKLRLSQTQTQTLSVSLFSSSLQELERAELSFVDVIRRCVGLLSKDVGLLQRAGSQAEAGEHRRAVADFRPRLFKLIPTQGWQWSPSPGTRVAAQAAAMMSLGRAVWLSC